MQCRAVRGITRCPYEAWTGGCDGLCWSCLQDFRLARRKVLRVMWAELEARRMARCLEHGLPSRDVQHEIVKEERAASLAHWLEHHPEWRY